MAFPRSTAPSFGSCGPRGLESLYGYSHCIIQTCYLARRCRLFRLMTPTSILLDSLSFESPCRPVLRGPSLRVDGVTIPVWIGFLRSSAPFSLSKKKKSTAEAFICRKIMNYYIHGDGHLTVLAFLAPRTIALGSSFSSSLPSARLNLAVFLAVVS